MFGLPVILLHVAEFHGTVNFASFDKSLGCRKSCTIIITWYPIGISPV